MRFWDSSAIVPLCCWEKTTVEVQSLLLRDNVIAVWWGTKVESVSALIRLRRDSYLTDDTFRQAVDALHNIESEWTEVAADDLVREQAIRALEIHRLRAADALQLGAAMVWAQMQPAHRELVSLDDRLRQAAAREGFTVLP